MKQEDFKLIVIPYFAKGAQGRELEFAVTGWRKFAKFPYRIVVVGDHHPIVDTGEDIDFIPCERVPETDIRNYRPHLDFIKKFEAVGANYADCTDGFVFVADDCYTINPVTYEEVVSLKYIEGGIDFDPNSPNPWRRDAMKTKRLLQSMGYPDRNFTTHLPVYFEWDKFHEMVETFGMRNNSYVVEDLYFNYFHPIDGAIEINGDDIYKCSVATTHPDPGRIMSAFQTKKWLNNNTDGYVPMLENMLASYYGI